MPKKGYKQSESHRLRVLQALSGRTDEEKDAARIKQCGRIPWNKDKKSPYSEETLARMSVAQKLRMASTVHPMLGKHHSEETRRKIGEAGKGRQFSETTRKLWSEQRKGNTRGLGYRHTEEAKKKISIANLNNKKTLGFKHSDEFRLKARVNALHRTVELGIIPFTNIGLNEKPLLDAQEQLDSVTILRQYPIEKLGYIIDGYCPETNTVYEVYENAHDRTVQEDLQRETEICNFLSCNFYIIWDRTH